MQISKYFASLGIEVDKASVTKVDKTLSDFEKRIAKFGNAFGKGLKLNIESFSVDQKKLDIVLGNALDFASQHVTFEISKFSVNNGALLRALNKASGEAGVLDTGGIAPRALSTAQIAYRERQATETKRRQELRNAEWQRRFDLKNSTWTQTQAHLSAQRLAEPQGHQRVGRVSGGPVMGLGGVVSGALALGLGGYGLSTLNQKNQQVVSAQLQTNSVVQQAGGTAAQGGAVFEWLRSEADRVGFNYLDAAPDFNKLLSGLTGAGMSVAQGQGVFKGFSELSRVNKLDRVAQSRVFRALSQVAGKGKLQSEELVGQLSESLPGAVSIFSQAYQNKLKAEGKGGDKTGQEAIAELFAAMKKGLVKGDILPYAGKEASARAEGGLAAASRASQAEQARMQNEINNQAIVASNAGLEEGFARLFRTISTGLSESTGLTRGLAEGFNEATKIAEKLILFPQSFARAIEGRDSLVADWLGEDQTKELREDWSEIRIGIEAIMGTKSPEWFNPLRDLAQELKDLIGLGGGISQRYRESKSVMSQIYAEGADPLSGAFNAGWFGLKSAGSLGAQGVGYGINKILDTLPFARHTPVSGIVGDFANYLQKEGDPVADFYIDKDRRAGLDTEAMYGPNGEGWRAANKERNMKLAMDVFGGYGPSATEAAGVKPDSDAYLQGTTQSTSNTNTFNMTFNMPTGQDQVEDWANQTLIKAIQKVMPTLPEK